MFYSPSRRGVQRWEEQWSESDSLSLKTPTEPKIYFAVKYVGQLEGVIQLKKPDLGDWQNTVFLSPFFFCLRRSGQLTFSSLGFLETMQNLNYSRGPFKTQAIGLPCNKWFTKLEKLLGSGVYTIVYSFLRVGPYCVILHRLKFWVDTYDWFSSVDWWLVLQPNCTVYRASYLVDCIDCLCNPPWVEVRKADYK